MNTGEWAEKIERLTEVTERFIAEYKSAKDQRRIGLKEDFYIRCCGILQVLNDENGVATEQLIKLHVNSVCCTLKSN